MPPKKKDWMVLTITKFIGPNHGKGMYNNAEIIEQITTTNLLFFHLSAITPQKVDPATRAKLGRPTTKPNVLKSPKALACNLTIAKDNPAVIL